MKIIQVSPDFGVTLQKVVISNKAYLKPLIAMEIEKYA